MSGYDYSKEPRMIGEKCFRCHAPLGSNPQGILLMYPGRERQEPPLYTLPRMYCHACIMSFYAWVRMEGYRWAPARMQCSGR